MKKLIVSFAFVLIALTSYAQSSSEHLTFKGIPIEGSMTEFCQKLKAKGFTSIGSENNLALFMGDFTGRNATIGVTATDDGKSVFAVAVLFDPSGEWNTLVNTYNYYKDLYTRKYGNPTISKEKNPAHSDSNTALMAEVHQGTVVWGSAWEVTGGNIELSIEKTSGIYEGMVMIRYRDSQNVETKIQKDLEDVIKGQLLVNYMSLSTYRIGFPYKKGQLAIDKCKYVDTVDYELEYEATSYEAGKREFVEIVREFGITYKKSQPKIKRAYDALRKKI